MGAAADRLWTCGQRKRVAHRVHSSQQQTQTIATASIRSKETRIPPAVRSHAVPNCQRNAHRFFRGGERLKWSGRNSLPDRILAADELATALREQQRVDPARAQIVIGHSHGGSILAHALSLHPELAPYVSGVFLATPFIDARARRDWIATARLAIVAILCLLVVVLTPLGFALAFVNFWSVVPWLALMVGAQTIGMLTTLPRFSNLLHSRFNPSALASTISTCHLPQGTYLFVRSTGDEASSGLSVMQFSAWAFSKLISLFTRTFSPNAQLLFERAFVVGSGFFGGMVWLILFDLLYYGLPFRDFWDLYWNSLTLPHKIGSVFSAPFLLVAALIVLFASVYFALFVIFFVVCWICHRSFGRASFVAAMFIELVVEQIPIGSHTLIHTAWMNTDDGLSHSSPYKNPDAITAIRDWIRTSVQS